MIMYVRGAQRDDMGCALLGFWRMTFPSSAVLRPVCGLVAALLGVFPLDSQGTTQEDLEFLRNQSITVEVNMARLYNYDVLRRRKAEEKRKAAEESKTLA